MIDLSLSGIEEWVNSQELADLAIEKNKLLHDGSGLGNGFLGWITLPEDAQEQVAPIQQITSQFKSKLNCVVVIGIGGSYLGTKSVLSALTSTLLPDNQNPEVLFAGHHLDQQYHKELLTYLENKNWGVVVISKSGTTTEPAVAFRFLRQAMDRQFGKNQAKDRILAITDQSKGALRGLADQEGFQSFVIPDNVGGRYSVLTPVGLVPIALAGIDIEALVAGGLSQMKNLGPETTFDENFAAQYASARNLLYQQGKTVEILANFKPALHDVAEWWKQLFGESEGKEHKGIYPASVDLTSDLHSMGQFIQEGNRNLFESALLIKESDSPLTLPKMEEDADQLNYLAGKPMEYINQQATEGTLLAHQDGGVPIIRITLERLDAFNLGELFYFFEKACGISGYLLGVNPFDQPGVEAYKKNMFALLGKPGFEKETETIRRRLK